MTWQRSLWWTRRCRCTQCRRKRRVRWCRACPASTQSGYPPSALWCSWWTVIYTDKKENQIFLIYREIQSEAVAKSYMSNSFLINEEMRKYFPIYEEAVSHEWLCNCSTLRKILISFLSVYGHRSYCQHRRGGGQYSHTGVIQQGKGIL